MLNNLIKEMNKRQVYYSDLARVLLDRKENIEAKIADGSLTYSELKKIHSAFFSDTSLSYLARIVL